jgi:16S rRNA processing protein RimM
MAMAKEEQGPYLAVGKVVGVHGVRGEVKVELMTDYPERFQPGARLKVGGGDEAVSAEIETARPHKGLMLVKFKSVPDRNGAELLRGKLLLIPEAEAMPLGEDENYAHDLVGLTVVTSDGRTLGKLTEILYTGANDVYVVAGPDGEVLIPALRDVVLKVDLGAGEMTVALPEGLVD